MVHFLFCSLSAAVDFVTVEATFYETSVLLIVVFDSEACCFPSLFCYCFSLILVLTQIIPLFL